MIQTLHVHKSLHLKIRLNTRLLTNASAMCIQSCEELPESLLMLQIRKADMCIHGTENYHSSLLSK